MGFLGWFFTILIIVFYILYKMGNTPKMRNERIKGTEDKIKNQLKEFGELKALCVMNKAIESNEEYLAVVGNEFHYKFNKKEEIIIPIEEIDDIGVEYNVKERNTMKVLTLMPTFDKTTVLIGIKLILFIGSDDITLDIKGFLCNTVKFDRLKKVLEESIKKCNID